VTGRQTATAGMSRRDCRRAAPKLSAATSAAKPEKKKAVLEDPPDRPAGEGTDGPVGIGGAPGVPGIRSAWPVRDGVAPRDPFAAPGGRAGSAVPAALRMMAEEAEGLRRKETDSLQRSEPRGEGIGASPTPRSCACPALSSVEAAGGGKTRGSDGPGRVVSDASGDAAGSDTSITGGGGLSAGSLTGGGASSAGPLTTPSPGAVESVGGVDDSSPSITPGEGSVPALSAAVSSTTVSQEAESQESELTVGLEGSRIWVSPAAWAMPANASVRTHVAARAVATRARR
jgi:hypothetical protein